MRRRSTRGAILAIVPLALAIMASVSGQSPASASVTTNVFAGTGTAGFSGDTGNATGAELNAPQGVAADAAGNVYIFDSQNHRIREVGIDGNIQTIAGNGSGCSTTGLSNVFGPDNPGICSSSYPVGFASDAAGELYFNNGGWVDETSSNGSLDHIAGKVTGNYYPGDGTAFSVNVAPNSLASDGQGGLYIAEGSTSGVPGYSIKYLSSDGIVSTSAGMASTSLCNSYPYDGEAAAGACIHPQDLTLWGHYLYFFDTSSGYQGPEMYRIDLSQSTLYLTKIAGTGSWSDYGNTGLAVNAGISHVGPIAVSSTGQVYFGNISTGEIRTIDSSADVQDVTTFSSGINSMAFAADDILYASVPSSNKVMKVTGLGSVANNGRLVSLGDSVAAGEGINYGFVWNGSGWTQSGPTSPTWTDTTSATGSNYQVCHQSAFAYSRLLYTRYQVQNMACTGASAVLNGILDDQIIGSTDVPAQLGWCGSSCSGGEPNTYYDGTSHSNEPDVVTLTVGMDDIDFGYWLNQCYQPLAGDCNTDPNDAEVDSSISAAEAGLNGVLQEIHDRGVAAGKLPHVFVTGYYNPFPSTYPGSPCKDLVPVGWANAGLSPNEAGWIEDELGLMNSNISYEASLFANVTYVDMSTVINGHGICSSDPWVFGASIDAPAIFGGTGLSGNMAPFHPTPAGQYAMYQAVNAEMVSLGY